MLNLISGHCGPLPEFQSVIDSNAKTYHKIN